MAENSFDATVEYLVKCLQKMSQTQIEKGDDPDIWLEILYQHYSERFTEDNNKIWTTASILIPISLAGFGAVATINQPSITQVVILMFASIALFTIWLVIAENHRAFQQKNQAWVVAIERIIGVEDRTGAKILTNFLNKLLTKKFGVQTAYWILYLGILICWVIILILTILGIF